MDPVSAIGLVGSVVGVTDIVLRSLNGLRSLQALYGSADRRVAITRGNLQSVKGALEEIQEWAEGMTDEAKSKYATLLARIDFAVQCCTIPLETLCESIESLKRKADGGGLSRRGKLSAMLGETELREMSLHLGNQVQALNLLLTAAFCKTQHAISNVLQDEDTRSILRQVEDDSASYIQREIETMSVMTRRSVVSDHGELLESTFDFDDIALDSRAYRQAFEMVIIQRKQRNSKDGTAQVARPDPASVNFSRNQVYKRTEAKSAPPLGTDNPLLRPSSSGSDGTIRNDTAKSGPTQTAEGRRSLSPSEQVAKSSVSHVTSDNKLMRDQEVQIRIPLAGETLDTKSNRQQEQVVRRQLNPETGFLSRLFNSKESRRTASGRDMESSEFKMLILGARQSGKSTFLKQMRMLHGAAYTEDERNSFKGIVFTNMVQSMRLVVKTMKGLAIPFEHDWDEYYYVYTILMQPPKISDTQLPLQLASALKSLHRDSGVQAAFQRLQEHQQDMNTVYYFDNIDRIAQPDYTVSDEDILRLPERSAGITETTFRIGKITYLAYDVGALTSERKKWIHYFQDVAVTVFLVDITAYDQLLFEDETVNRMQEALTLFDSICNSRWFDKTAMLLFLNKTDIFKSKLANSPMQNYFPDYKGGVDYEAACDYILNRFVCLNQHESKQIYTHFICALDPTNMRLLLAAVTDIILAVNLRNSELL